jgi:undecaprenyl-diphosphatase
LNRVNIAAAFLFTLIVLDVRLHGPLSLLDQRITQWWLNTPNNPFVTTTMLAVTFFGSRPATIAFTVAIVWYVFRRGEARWARTLAVAACSEFALTELFKVLLQRPRPDLEALAIATGYSLPSGHAAAAATLYGWLAVYAHYHLPRGLTRTLAVTSLLVMIVLIGSSRIYLGVHYFSDVVAGYSLAAGVLGVVLGMRDGAEGG